MLKEILELYYSMQNKGLDSEKMDFIIAKRIDQTKIKICFNKNIDINDDNIIEDYYNSLISKIKRFLKKEKIEEENSYLYILSYFIKVFNIQNNKSKIYNEFFSTENIDNSIIKKIEENFSPNNVFLNFELPPYIITNAITPYIFSVLSEKILDIMEKKQIKSELGFFITPQTTYDYMIRESIISYLNNQLISNNKEQIEDFINNKKNNEYIQANKEKILTELKKIKFLDPTTGSGNFFIGFVIELSFLMYILDNTKDINYWFNFVLTNNVEAIELNNNLTKFLLLRLYCNKYVMSETKLNIKNKNFLTT